MREMLIMWITNFVRFLLGSKNQAVDADKIDEEEIPPCPICGEEWDKDEIFCYHCGYELVDAELPLNPPPERTGAVTDPDGVLGEEIRIALDEMFTEVGKSNGWDIAVLILTKELAKRVGPDAEDGRGEHPDGLAYCLYNTWMMGKDTDLKGLLLVVDPNGEDRALVTGRNGPDIGGAKLRKWYGELESGEGFDLSEPSAIIADELQSIAGKFQPDPVVI